MRTLILSGADVRRLLDPAAVLEAVESAFAAHGRGDARMPCKVYLPLPEFGGDFRAMPAYLDGTAGVKWINAHPDNPQRQRLPAVMGVYIYSDPRTGLPLAIMDATGLTALRTGAAAAVATRHLARKDATVLGVIGCGAQAESLVRAHGIVMSLEEVRLHDRQPGAATRLAACLPDLACRVCALGEAAAADVVCTLTPSRQPIVEGKLLSPGAHINAMGADAPGKRELDDAVLGLARIFVDDREQASESGEINVPLHAGTLDRGRIAGTLGEVVAGSIAGRVADEITIFDSTGLAIQDLAVARIVYERARARGIGLEVPLITLDDPQP
jgi:ornithine cyclodeaminase/alanine dehydrogenase